MRAYLLARWRTSLHLQQVDDAVQEVFRLSDKATVHMKDQMSGPEGFVPFARAVLRGLADYEPKPSPNAVLRAGRPG